MLEILVGFSIVAILLADIFQAVLVPRFTPASLRLAPLLIGRMIWPVCRRLALLMKNESVQDYYLGAFAPMAFVMIFLTWMVAMTLAFGLIIHGLGSEFHPRIHEFHTAFYLAGTSLLTLGFGDIVAKSFLGRIIVLLGAVTGITVVAVGVSFLFSMQQSVHNREIMVNAFQSRIDKNCSAVSLLLSYADRGITSLLATQINDWETWAADVLSSHRSFPLLCYFRSGHMCVSWITVLGIMLDAANLFSTTINDPRFGHSEFFLDIGCKLVQFFKDYLKLSPENSCVSREEFGAAFALLRDRGYLMHEEEIAWERFHITRSQYAPSLNALAKNFVCATPGWLEQFRHVDLSLNSEVSENQVLTATLKK
jgi:hypothetical protein